MISTPLRLVAVSTLVLVGACTRDISPRTYSVGSIGQINRSVAGSIISVREVSIAGTTGLGGGAGAVGGGVVGSAAGGGVRGSAIGALGGAIVGGIAGSVIEANATKQQALEYVIQTENGNLMTIVQGISPVLKEGDKVLVLYGVPARLIVDPRINR